VYIQLYYIATKISHLQIFEISFSIFIGYYYLPNIWREGKIIRDTSILSYAWLSKSHDTVQHVMHKAFSWLSTGFVSENRFVLCIKLYTQVVSIDLECDNIGEHNRRSKRRILFTPTRAQSTLFAIKWIKKIYYHFLICTQLSSTSNCLAPFIKHLLWDN